jgi:hypothetical protein
MSFLHDGNPCILTTYFVIPTISERWWLLSSSLCCLFTLLATSCPKLYILRHPTHVFFPYSDRQALCPYKMFKITHLHASDSFGLYRKHGNLLISCIPQGTIWPVLPCCLVHTTTSQRRIYCVPGHHRGYARGMVGDQLAGYSVGPWPHSFVSHQQLPTIPVQLPSKYHQHQRLYNSEWA